MAAPTAKISKKSKKNLIGPPSTVLLHTVRNLHFLSKKNSILEKSDIEVKMIQNAQKLSEIHIFARKIVKLKLVIFMFCKFKFWSKYNLLVRKFK